MYSFLHLVSDQARNITVVNINKYYILYAGADPEGGAPGAPPPKKLEKNMIVLRKIVIFHTKYTKNFRASLRSARLFLSAPPPLTWTPGSSPDTVVTQHYSVVS